MTGKARAIWAAASLAMLASGSLLMAAQSGGKRSAPAQQSVAVGQSIAVGQQGNAGLSHRPDTVVALTAAECENFGGKVVKASAGSCTGTGKSCVTANKDGTMHSSCITAQ